MYKVFFGAVFAASLVMPTWAASNGLDDSFNDGNPVDLSAVGAGITHATAMEVTTAGVTTVRGQCGADFCIVRYLANGSLDTDHGLGGKLTFAATLFDSAQPFAAFPVAKEEDTDDDKYWVLGNRATAGQRLVIARTNDTGVLDTTFDTDGRADIALAGFDVRGLKAISDGSGRMYIVGLARLRESDAREVIFMTRLTAAGAVDATFFGSGKHFFDLDIDGQEFSAVIDQFTFSNDGKLLLTLHTTDLTNNVGMVIRLNNSGAFDATFNDGGTRIISVNDADVSNVVVQSHSDNRIIAVADVLNNSAQKFTALQMYKSDGLLDTTFSSDGREMAQPGGQALHAHSVNWLLEGGFLLIGLDDANQLWTTRYLADGSIANSGADQWSAEGSDSIVQTAVMAGGQWLVLAENDLRRLVGDDRSPVSFAIPAKNDVAINSTVVSDPIAITGLEKMARVSADGDAAFLVSETNACSTSGTFLASTTVESGDFLCVKVATSTEANTEKSTTIYVGDVGVAFVTKTQASSSGGGGGGGGAFWPVALIGLLLIGRRKVQR